MVLDGGTAQSSLAVAAAGVPVNSIRSVTHDEAAFQQLKKTGFFHAEQQSASKYVQKAKKSSHLVVYLDYCSTLNVELQTVLRVIQKQIVVEGGLLCITCCTRNSNSTKETLVRKVKTAGAHCVCTYSYSTMMFMAFVIGRLHRHQRLIADLKNETDNVFVV